MKNFERQLDKIDANICPEPNGTINVEEERTQDEIVRPSVYDAIVNDKVVKTNGIPKFTFES